MKCITKGKEFCQDFESPVFSGYGTIYIEEKCNYMILSGTEVNTSDGNTISGPVIICGNDHKQLDIIVNDVNSQYVYFKPSLINASMTYENIESNEFTQDKYLLRPFFLRTSSFNGVISLSLNEYEILSKLFMNVDFELSEQPDFFWPCRSRSYVLEILIHLSRHLVTKEDPTRTALVQKIMTFLHDNYSDRITLDTLTDTFAINRTTINNEFTKATGYSVIDYLIHLRIDIACTMLRDTRIPITEIMYRVGYNDSSSFWRTFKKINNMSPSEFRNKNCIVDD